MLCQSVRAGARHLEVVDRADGAPVHDSALTRPTKMSSSELCVVCRSLKRMPAALSAASSARDAGALGLRVVGVDQLAPAIGEREVERRQRLGDRVERLRQLQRELLLAELAHQLGLLLDQDELALVDDADAVGHLLGFLDVVRGEDDGDAGGAQRAHHLPHVLAQLDVDAGGRLVEEQDARLVRQRLGDQHAALHAAGQRHDLAVLLVPQRELLQHLLDDAPGSFGLPNRPRLKLAVAHTVSNASVCSSCGTRPISARAAR